MRPSCGARTPGLKIATTSFPESLSERPRSDIFTDPSVMPRRGLQIAIFVDQFACLLVAFHVSHFGWPTLMARAASIDTGDQPVVQSQGPAAPEDA